jgi:hypothetical protein
MELRSSVILNYTFARIKPDFFSCADVAIFTLRGGTGVQKNFFLKMS